MIQQQELWNFYSLLREADEDRHVSGVSLHGGIERPLCDAVMLET